MNLFNKKQQKKTNKALWAAIIGTAAGVAAGVAVGLLMAPEDGKETRKKIVKGAADLGGKVATGFNEGVDKATTAAKDLANKVEHN